MGRPTWNIRTQMAYGIIVAIKDVRAAFAESSEAISMAGAESDSKKFGSTSSEDCPALLEDEIKLWMLQQVGEGFKIVDVYSVFVLVMHQDDEFFDNGSLCLLGPDEIYVDYHGFYIHVLPGGLRNLDIDDDLVRIASALTPTGRKLRYRPGTCLLCCTYNFFIGTYDTVITHPDHKIFDEEPQLSWVQSQQQENSVPSDLIIVVGTGDEERVFSFNRAAFAFYLPKLVHLVDAQGSKADDAMSGENATAVLRLLDITVDAFEHVVDHFVACLSPPPLGCKNTGGYLRNSRRRKTEVEFLVMLGVFDDEKESAENKRARVEKKDDKKSNRNVTFLVGPDETPVTAQREVLAASNPVLCRILYGLDRSNPTMPDSIKWPDFDAVAVERVLAALVHRKTATYAPYTCRRLLLAVLDYLGETELSVSMDYDELPRLVIKDEDEFRYSPSPTTSFGIDAEYEYFLKNP